MRCLPNRNLRYTLRIARAMTVLVMFTACAASFRTALLRQIGDEKISFHSVALGHAPHGPVMLASR